MGTAYWIHGCETVIVVELLENLQEIPAQLISRSSELFKFQMQIRSSYLSWYWTTTTTCDKSVGKVIDFLTPLLPIQCHGLLKDLLTPCFNLGERGLLNSSIMVLV